MATLSALTLAAGTGLILVAAGLLAYVGLLFARRAARGPEPLALGAFAAWWWAAAAVLALLGSHTVLAVAGITDQALHEALSKATNLPLAIALWALTYYLLFLYTGSRRLLAPIALLCVAYFLYLAWYAAATGPRHLEWSPWDVSFVPDEPPDRAAANVYALLFGGPVVFATLAYSSLFFQVREATPRYRVALVSLSFLVLFGVVVLGLLLAWNDHSWYALTYEVAAVLAALGVLAAYRPPRKVQRAWNVQAVGVAP